MRCWYKKRALYFPTVRPDSDGSRRAAHRKMCLPLVWTECTYLNLVPVTAVAMETVFQGCVSVTWGILVRPQTCVLWFVYKICISSYYISCYFFQRNRFRVYSSLSSNCRILQPRHMRWKIFIFLSYMKNMVTQIY